MEKSEVIDIYEHKVNAGRLGKVVFEIPQEDGAAVVTTAYVPTVSLLELVDKQEQK